MCHTTAFCVRSDGNQGAHDKPAILCFVAAVEEHERARIRGDRDARKWILWRKHDALACGNRSWLRGSACVFLHRAIGMARENAGARVENEGFSEIGSGQELQVESRFANESGRERLVEVYCDAKAVRFRCDLNVIAEAAIRIRKRGAELIAGERALAILELRNRIPLLWRGRKAYIAVGGDPFAMQNDFDTAHLFVAEDTVIRVVENENAEALGLEAVLIVQPEVGGTQRKDAEQQDRDGGKDRR